MAQPIPSLDARSGPVHNHSPATRATGFLDALAAQIPRDELALRRVIAERPVASALAAAALGSVGMQLGLALLRRPTVVRVARPRQSRAMPLALVSALLSVVRRPARPAPVAPEAAVPASASGTVPLAGQAGAVDWAAFAEFLQQRESGPRRKWKRAQARLDEGAGEIADSVKSAADRAASRLGAGSRAAADLAHHAALQALNQVRDSAQSRPIGAVAVAAGAGFLLTLLLSRR